MASPRQQSFEKRCWECLDYVRSHATEGDASSVWHAIDDFSRANFLMNIGDAKGDIVDKELESIRPKIMAEIGALAGYSAVRFASKIRDLSGPDVRYYSFEIGPGFADIASQMVAFAGLSDIVTFIVGPFEETYTKLRELKVDHLDTLFIDHRSSEYLPDLKRVEEGGWLRKGSVVIADNVLMRDPDGYLEYVRTHPKFSSKLIESHMEYREDVKDGIEISVRLAD